MTQDFALHLMKSGKNVFLTGAPGTGKTHVLRSYINYLREEKVPHAVLAPTGIAASHLDGSTVHSYFGFGPRDHINQFDLEELTEREYLWKRMRALRVLIIDEVSMLSPDLFRSIDLALRTFRFSSEPFGGVQVILSGDFFQLPPIREGRKGERFAFQTEVWEHLQLRGVALEESYRQEDERFLEVLRAIRERRLNEQHIQVLRSREGVSLGEVGVRLYTHNVDVDTLNERSLEQLEGSPQIFSAQGKGAKKWQERIFQASLVPRELRLKRNAPVLFIRNDSEGKYVNGTLGTVVRFEGGLPVVRTRAGKEILVRYENWDFRDAEGKTLAQVRQIPLRLAWAITIHKSQGMTLDAAEVDLSKAFAPGQGYVALSRIRSLDGLSLRGMNEQALRVDPLAADFQDTVAQESRNAYAHFIQKERGEKEREERAFLSRLKDV